MLHFFREEKFSSRASAGGGRDGRARLALLGGCAAAALLGGAPVVLAQDGSGWNMYGSGTSYTVRYEYPLSTAISEGYGLSLNVELGNNSPISLEMDTGSTGIVVSQSLAPGLVSNGTEGWVYYNSSGLLLTGYFADTTVTFSQTVGQDAAVATVPVLVATNRYCILPDSKNPCDPDPSATVAMMGVGFDRNTMGTGSVDPTEPGLGAILDAAPATSATLNPFLNIEGMQSGTVHAGYILTPDGVELGLTSENTASVNGHAFSYGQLQPLTEAQGGAQANNWQAVPVAISVNGSAQQIGSILMDTGVPDGFLVLPGLSSAGLVDKHGRLLDGTSVVVDLLGSGGLIGYSFTVGGSSPQQPEYVDWVKKPVNDEVFFNSSLYTYNGFNILYDAENGFFGVQLNDYEPGVQAVVIPILVLNGVLQPSGVLNVDLPVLLAGDATVSTAAADVLFTGTVTGPNALTVTGGGTLTLTGAGTYSGGTVISGATLQLGNGGTTGSITGDVTDNGVLVFNRSDAVTFTGNISGSGSVAQAGSGTLTLTGANTYSGGTAINSGATLQLGNGGTAGSIDGDVADNGVLVFNRSDAVTFAGNISGSGSVVQAGSGTLTLTGANTYSGGTAVNAGALQLATSGAAGSGAISLSDGSALLYADGTDIANPLDVAGSVVLNVNAGSATQSGMLSGSGSFTVTGGGVLQITSAAGYGGLAAVASGTLAINGSFGGAVVVGQGGLLKGSGTVGTAAVLSGGTLAPGNSIGTLHVAGGVTFAAGSTYQVEADAAGNSDQIAASGTATINGGTVQVLAADGPYAWNTRYTILTATGGITGTGFSGVTSSLAYLTPSLDYDATTVSLFLLRNDIPFCLAGFGGNQCRVANAVEALGANNALYDAVVQLDAAGADLAFEALAGDVYASTETVLLQDTRFVRDAATDRLRSAYATAAAGTIATAHYDDNGTPAAQGATDDTAVWMRGFGSWGQFGGTADAAGIDRDIGGVFLGIDRGFDGWRLGLMGGYSASSLNFSGGSASQSIDSYSVALYGGRQWGALGLRLGAAYGWNDISSSRFVAFSGYSDALDADYSARTAQLFGEFGWQVQAGPVALEPFAGLAWVHYDGASFSESGGTAALQVGSTSAGVGFSTLGLRASGIVWNDGGLTVTARAMAGWRATLGDTASSVSTAFAGGTAFEAAGLPLARNAAVLEAGLDTPVSANLSLGIAYSGTFGSGLSDNGVQASVKWRF